MLIVIRCSYQVAHHPEARRLMACWDAFEISRLTFLDTCVNAGKHKGLYTGVTDPFYIIPA